ncbi:Protein N-acetyltransferase, RimJ/RimL family [Yoonia tamlensis]|uniref:Protein N-acetyltransferase, RimJ/RimL family n=1 Tax=Yoonia tamlensis TaxID=390270 RepID=A0A1I6G540_9RHOB|nr:GNAT family N-acetyltransferase [Yoonia tamlensis]SFR37309.1 Protein N-acetyltransferase, RimJ/RimL family [Yoonia tamlensis]
MPKAATPPVADFRTPRLRVSHWATTLADADAYAKVLQDLPALLNKEVTRDLPPSLALGESISDWVAARARESDVYLVTTNDKMIGLLILFRAAPDAAIHLGYLFAQNTWGQGYATELLRGLLAATPPPATLLAGVATTNPASAHVLRKAGFEQQPAQSEGMLAFARVIAG